LSVTNDTNHFKLWSIDCISKIHYLKEAPDEMDSYALTSDSKEIIISTNL